MNEHHEYRIGPVLAFLMISWAIVLDIVSLLSVFLEATGIGIVLSFLDLVLDVPSWLSFWLIFSLHGVAVGFERPGRLLLGIGSLGVEFTEFADFLPGWVAWVGGIILLSRIEDSSGFRIPALGTQKKTKGGVQKVVNKTVRRLRDPRKTTQAVQRLRRIKNVNV